MPISTSSHDSRGSSAQFRVARPFVAAVVSLCGREPLVVVAEEAFHAPLELPRDDGWNQMVGEHPRIQGDRQRLVAHRLQELDVASGRRPQGPATVPQEALDGNAGRSGVRAPVSRPPAIQAQAALHQPVPARSPVDLRIGRRPQPVRHVRREQRFRFAPAYAPIVQILQEQTRLPPGLRPGPVFQVRPEGVLADGGLQDGRRELGEIEVAFEPRIGTANVQRAPCGPWAGPVDADSPCFPSARSRPRPESVSPCRATGPGCRGARCACCSPCPGPNRW